jgi:hypothetical protein
MIITGAGIGVAMPTFTVAVQNTVQRTNWEWSLAHPSFSGASEGFLAAL